MHKEPSSIVNQYEDFEQVSDALSPFDEYEDLLESEDDTQDEEIYLEYVDDISGVVDYAEIEKRTSDVLSEYTFEEVLNFNEMDNLEALTLLVYAGHAGLPAVIEEDEEDETVSPEEEED